MSSMGLRAAVVGGLEGTSRELYQLSSSVNKGVAHNANSIERIFAHE